MKAARIIGHEPVGVIEELGPGLTHATGAARAKVALLKQARRTPRRARFAFGVAWAAAWYCVRKS